MEDGINYDYLETTAKRSTSDLFIAIQQMSIEEVGRLLLNPLDKYPNLKSALPEMPADAIQIAWTGNAGMELLKQSISFVKTMTHFYEKTYNKNLKGSKILDYGCGWGRLIRLMYKFTSPDNIYGCDAWQQSLQICLDTRVRANLRMCAEVPETIPFNDVKFDLIYAFSVFTHLSEKTGLSVISALRRVLSDDGMLAVTIRPLDYWKNHDQKQSPVDVTKMEYEHRKRGFAFTPHNRSPINGDITYGDTSISLDFIAKYWNGLKIVGEESFTVDPFQKIIYLQPVLP